ncbi:hypothetical protein GALMADRAFT_256084 [Galerina marginata CBS 339.88]|uniref:Uncharacterized protein n=1 Tax=Galerina marginata (strain CBS 339.88) TaxID=685588 RepID=A0A067SR23_GALM3|nr:hypothetical protein GALMADRAFT_256084 [Galerina marginata CBS 339.88]
MSVFSRYLPLPPVVLPLPITAFTLHWPFCVHLPRQHHLLKLNGICSSSFAALNALEGNVMNSNMSCYAMATGGLDYSRLSHYSYPLVDDAGYGL